MKKILALLLAAVLLCSFAACGKEPDTNNVPDETTESVNQKLQATASPAQKLWEKYQLIYSNDLSTEDLANKLIADLDETYPMMGALPVEEGPLNGFTEEITGFVEATQFAPMIGSIPFVGYVFRLAPDADTDAFIKMLHDSADLRWNICTEADNMLCESLGNTVYFVMGPESFEN